MPREGSCQAKLFALAPGPRADAGFPAGEGEGGHLHWKGYPFVHALPIEDAEEQSREPLHGSWWEEEKHCRGPRGVECGRRILNRVDGRGGVVSSVSWIPPMSRPGAKLARSTRTLSSLVDLSPCGDVRGGRGAAE